MTTYVVNTLMHTHLQLVEVNSEVLRYLSHGLPLFYNLGQVILSPQREIPSRCCKSVGHKSWFSCLLQWYSVFCLLKQLLKHFKPHCALCSLSTSCLSLRSLSQLSCRKIVLYPRFQHKIIKGFLNS